MNNSRRIIYIFLVLILILVLVGAAYWYFFFETGAPPSTPSASQSPGGFSPFGRAPSASNAPQTSPGGLAPTDIPAPPAVTGTIPTLRLLSRTPIGAYGASTTASTTIVRWIDRGRGNVSEVRENALETTVLSNTILPRIYEGSWNRNLTAFIASMLPENEDAVTTVYSELRKRSATTTASSTPAQDASKLAPFDLRGKNLPSDIISYAVAPTGDKVFILIREGGQGVGYIANFDGTGMARILSTPLTQVMVEWPELNTIAITTKSQAAQDGFLYFVNPKTGAMRKIIGPVPGLATRTSHDARYVIASSAGAAGNMQTAIYRVGSTTPTDALALTLADKCAWGNFYTNIVYCAVPTQQLLATYPDDWYKGRLSFVDRLWQINAATGEIKLVSNIVGQSDRVIDAFNLGLDPKDNFLFFMNKNDLTFWSFDLVRSN